jgi:fimbrial chaperone protein
MMRFLPLLAMLPLLLAFNFSPMSQSIDLGEGRRGTQFLIENEGADNVAVELSVKSRALDEKGVETLSATSDISVFPPQIIIPPGEKRTIRVTYNLKDKPEFEKNYRVIAEQLPLKVDAKTKDQAGIKMLMKYVAALYATPADSKADVKLVSHQSDGKEMTLIIENKGQRHQLINNPVIKFIQNGKKGELKTADLVGVAGENVLAGQKRVFVIKTSKTIPKDAKVELKIND